MCFLWRHQSHNYVWLLSHIFIPGFLSGLSGLITTFVNVYATQDGVLGASSIATLAVTGTCTVICGLLAAFYWIWKLDPVKRQYRRQVQEREKAEPTLVEENRLPF
jgi:hypothetical protein